MEFEDSRSLMPFITASTEKSSHANLEGNIFFCDMEEKENRFTSVTDYPIAAYKSISPDNKEIVIMHLSNKIPQRSIFLGRWEFLSFVDGKF